MLNNRGPCVDAEEAVAARAVVLHVLPALHRVRNQAAAESPAEDSQHGRDEVRESPAHVVGPRHDVLLAVRAPQPHGLRPHLQQVHVYGHRIGPLLDWPVRVVLH